MAQDYFNTTNETYVFLMPDGVSKVVFRKLTEGDRIAVQGGNGVELNRKTDTVKIDVNTEEMKLNVIKRAIIGWELWSNEVAVPFDNIKVEEFVQNLDPDVIDLMYEFLGDKNRWLKGNKDTDDLKKRLDELQKQLREAQDREKK